MAGLTDRLLVTIDATSSGAVAEMDKLQRKTRDTDSSFDKLGRTMGVTGGTLKAGLVAGAAALVGTGLVQFLNDSVAAFTESAKAAGDLAEATGSTPETISRMIGALEDAGVSSEKTAGLLTKFTTSAGKNQQALDKLGVTLVKGADGNIDYAASMVKVVDAIGDVGDASERNRLLVEFFGKQGAKAFQDLYASGVNLSDAMAAISKYRVFGVDDVRRAVAYDDAMDSLKASVQGVQFAVGSALVPVLSTAASVFSGLIDAAAPLLDILTSVPTDIYLVAGAAALLAKVITTDLVAGALAKLIIGITTVGVVSTSASLQVALLRGAFTSLTAAIAANPIGAALVVLTGAYAALSTASSSLKRSAEGAVDEVLALEKAGESAATALHRTAVELTQSEGFWSRLGAGLRGTDSPVELIKVLGSNSAASAAQTQGYSEAIEEARTEMGEYAFQTGQATAGQKTLNDMLAAGETDYTKLADAAQAVIDGEETANRVREESARIIAVESGELDKLVSLRLTEAGLLGGVEGAYKGAEDAAIALGEAHDLGATLADENRIAMEDFATALDGYVTAAKGADTPDKTILANLDAMKQKYPEAAGVIDAAIEGVKTGSREASEELDELTKDRDTNITVESRGGPAVDRYLDGLASQKRLARINVESRGGPAVDRYLDGLAGSERLARIRVESRNGPAVDDYLDSLASQYRLALIHVESRGGPAVDRYLDSLASQGRTASISAQQRITAGTAAATRTTGATGAVSNTWHVTISGARDPEATVRALQRYARDNGRPANSRVVAV